MRPTGDQRAEATRGKPNRSARAKATTSEDTTPLTQDELLRWWPFTRLDPKRFPKRKRGADIDNLEEALL